MSILSWILANSYNIKEEEARRLQHKQQQHQEEISSKAYKLFSEGRRPVEVAIVLNLREPEATKLYREYWRLRGLDKLNVIYQETNGKIWSLLKLYKLLIKEKGMGLEKVTNVVDIAANKLPHMDILYSQVKEEVENLQRIRQGLINDIEALKYKISLLDKTAFSCEQDCRRTQQQLQELTAQKNRIEEWIANVSNNDELKQIVKENVKAALSENKQVLSVSFTALLQTLTSDPQLINIIYKILTANDGEPYKDNKSYNAIKYLESNKDSILDLAEKHYENLLEALTNNIIDTGDSSFSNPTLSLPSSSSFLGSYNQSITYRIEESDTHHNSTGDIAE